jgi:xanthosine utilization system XapX-like protein
MAMLAGAVLSAGWLYILSDNPPPVTVAFVVLVGMIIGQAVRTAVTRR